MCKSVEQDEVLIFFFKHNQWQCKYICFNLSPGKHQWMGAIHDTTEIALWINTKIPLTPLLEISAPQTHFHKCYKAAICRHKILSEISLKYKGLHDSCNAQMKSTHKILIDCITRNVTLFGKIWMIYKKVELCT